MKYNPVAVAISPLAMAGLLIFTTSCQGESDATEQTPTAIVQSVTPTPPPTAFEFPKIPAAPEGVSGADSLADLMSYLDGKKGPIESKDYMLKEGGRIPEDPRINFEVKIKGVWFKGDEVKFEHKRDAFLAWLAETRNLSGADCQHITFSTPNGSLMRYTNPETGHVIDRNVGCR